MDVCAFHIEKDIKAFCFTFFFLSFVASAALLNDYTESAFARARPQYVYVSGAWHPQLFRSRITKQDHTRIQWGTGLVLDAGSCLLVVEERGR